MQDLRIHGEYDDVHKSTNFHFERVLRPPLFTTIGIIKVDDAIRIVFNFTSLSDEHPIYLRLYGNVLENPNVLIRQENGWYNHGRKINSQGLFTFSAAEFDRHISIVPGKTMIWHEYLYGVQYIAIVARTTGGSNNARLLVTGQVAN